MFGLLNSSQIYGIQQAHEHINNSSTNHNSNNKKYNNNNNSNNNKHRRSTSSVSDSIKESKFFTSLSSMQGMKSPTSFIEKFIKSELLNGYDTLRNYKNFQHTNSTSSSSTTGAKQTIVGHNSLYPEAANLTGFNCLQGSYRSNCESEFYETVNVSGTHSKNAGKTSDMTIKCSKSLLAESTHAQGSATLQNYHKLPDCENDTQSEVVTHSSGASSGEFNSDATASNSNSSGLYKKLSFGGRSAKSSEMVHVQQNELASDNSSSSITTTTTNSSANRTSSVSMKSNDLQRTSSASSSGDCNTTTTLRERKKNLATILQRHSTMEQGSLDTAANVNSNIALTPERAQRRKLLQTISNFDQQNKLLQRELAKEKRRRTEELACVVKSLICFESKLKHDMKAVNHRLLEKDTEICRLVRQNRALRKKLAKLQQHERENVRDEGVVEDDDDDETAVECESDKELIEDCLVLEALQCINCRKQFYDIEMKEDCTQTMAKDGGRNNDDHTTEHGTSSDDTVSSSFYGARRSVRYTSKRTSGTFRDYMRSRSMNIDDPALDNNSEENTSTISREDSQTSYEKIYSRTIERMHGVKCESERDSELSGLETTRTPSRLSNKSSSSSRCSKASEQITAMEEDDGIFSPTQDDDFDEDVETGGCAKIVVQRRTKEFSEASPKQVYETSTDDWYASASDQDEIGAPASKSYGQGTVNPVLECVNQILLQQSMEESLLDRKQIEQQTQLTPKSSNQLQITANLPRRSSLSGRRGSRNNSQTNDGGQQTRSGTLTRKRVHFSTKNSMVHVPRNDDVDEDDEDIPMESGVHTKLISSLQPYNAMNFFPPTTKQIPQSLHTATPTNVISSVVTLPDERLETLNYESIYSNEYEPIGSEHNSSNLYVDMETAVKATVNGGPAGDLKLPKMPPALPPKPANLLKFKKSLQQLDEVPDEHLLQDCDSSTTGAITEPDYCSISEVNVGITSVQIVADVHNVPESEADIDTHSLDVPASELDLEVSTVASDDTCAASQKTEDIEEIFADIPKLPNVAAIIAPKTPKASKFQPQQSDYLSMSPKVETTPNLKLPATRKLVLTGTSSATNEFLSSNCTKSPKLESTALKLPLQQGSNAQQQQYKRKHMPNILAEINKRMSLPNSPTTPTKLTPSRIKPLHSPNTLLKKLEESGPSLPLQAEFDWYNLDAEYGKAPLNPPELLKVGDNLNGSKILAEIHEDHECNVSGADEYNLDEEFSLASEKNLELVMETALEEQEEQEQREEQVNEQGKLIEKEREEKGQICHSTNLETHKGVSETINQVPLYNGNSPLGGTNAKAKKMKKNLANFEKFMEGAGMSTKPLPSKRKIYFAGPFV